MYRQVDQDHVHRVSRCYPPVVSFSDPP
jgi:hypothetical protein